MIPSGWLAPWRASARIPKRPASASRSGGRGSPDSPGRRRPISSARSSAGSSMSAEAPSAGSNEPPLQCRSAPPPATEHVPLRIVHDRPPDSGHPHLLRRSRASGSRGPVGGRFKRRAPAASGPAADPALRIKCPHPTADVQGEMEKRKRQRAKRRLTCELVVGEDRYPAIVRDISPTGLFVQTRAKPEAGSVVEVIFAARDGQPEIQVEAGVARHRIVPPRLQGSVQGGVGLELLSPPPRARTRGDDPQAHAREPRSATVRTL